MPFAPVPRCMHGNRWNKCKLCPAQRPRLTLPCPACEARIAIPDIGSRTPPGTEVVCACRDAIGVLYTDEGPIMIWWRPHDRITVQIQRDDDPEITPTG